MPAEIETRDWDTHKQEDDVVLQVLVTTKLSGRVNIRVKVTVDGENSNVSLPVTTVKDTIYGNDPRGILQFFKIDPTKPWGGKFSIDVSTSGQAVKNYYNRSAGTDQPSSHGNTGYYGGSNTMHSLGRSQPLRQQADTGVRVRNMTSGANLNVIDENDV